MLTDGRRHMTPVWSRSQKIETVKKIVCAFVCVYYTVKLFVLRSTIMNYCPPKGDRHAFWAE